MPTSSLIYVQANAAETRVALLSGGRLQELHVEDAAEEGLLGNIYKGKVARVLPGIEAAFIDLGEGKNGFLPARELVSTGSNSEASVKNLGISSLLHQGQNCLVQVIKESVQDKGPQLSTNMSLATRNLVYLPYARPTGVVLSNKIEDATTREKLKWIIEEALAAQEDQRDLLGSLIIRTHAASASVTELTSELAYLLSRQATLQAQSAAGAPALMLKELPLYLRFLRDGFPDEVDEVVFDNHSQYVRAVEFAQNFFPDLRQHLRMIEDSDESRLKLIAQGAQEALSRTVTLPSGANLIFDYTTALTVVDVNTASFVGKKNSQYTLLQTNLEAAKILAQQLRLRAIGGIIIVDFIDMDSASDRRKLLQVLETELQQDPVPTTCAAKSDLGLVEISRQRSRASLQQSFQQACHYCQGTGLVTSAKSMSLVVLAELTEIIHAGKVSTFNVNARHDIIHYLRTHLNKPIQSLRDNFDIEISLHSQPEAASKPYFIQLGD